MSRTIEAIMRHMTVPSNGLSHQRNDTDIHQAIKPENLNPKTIATPVRQPIVANCPSVSVEKR